MNLAVEHITCIERESCVIELDGSASIAYEGLCVVVIGSPSVKHQGVFQCQNNICSISLCLCSGDIFNSNFSGRRWRCVISRLTVNAYEVTIGEFRSHHLVLHVFLEFTSKNDLVTFFQDGSSHIFLGKAVVLKALTAVDGQSRSSALGISDIEVAIAIESAVIFTLEVRCANNESFHGICLACCFSIFETIDNFKSLGYCEFRWSRRSD